MNWWLEKLDWPKRFNWIHITTFFFKAYFMHTVTVKCITASKKLTDWKDFTECMLKIYKKQKRKKKPMPCILYYHTMYHFKQKSKTMTIVLEVQWEQIYFFCILHSRWLENSPNTQLLSYLCALDSFHTWPGERRQPSPHAWTALGSAGPFSTRQIHCEPQTVVPLPLNCSHAPNLPKKQKQTNKIMDICKAPTLRLKVLNKYNTHNVHQDGKCYQQFNKKLTHNVDINMGSSITM